MFIKNLRKQFNKQRDVTGLMYKELIPLLN